MSAVRLLQSESMYVGINEVLNLQRKLDVMMWSVLETPSSKLFSTNVTERLLH